jgi:hypothetical protein
VYPAAVAREKGHLGRRAGRKGMERDIEIVAAGEKVELNPFSEAIVINTLVGLLGSLKGVKTDSEIHVVLRPKRTRP